MLGEYVEVIGSSLRRSQCYYNDIKWRTLLDQYWNDHIYAWERGAGGGVYVFLNMGKNNPNTIHLHL